ncbi:MAG: substrate-binding domain-containing protein [Chloroflexi bacterium]|nr:substrate-binding domain-containing protein [Chloroflexota bacterium]
MSISDFRRVTLDDVARAAGVSSQTVSRVVNEHPYVSERTRRRVLEAIRKLDYRPNRAARSLATQQSHMLGIITYGFPFYGPAQMMRYVEQTARARGYGVSFATVNDLSLSEIGKALQNLGDHAVDGLVLITPVIGATPGELERLCGGIPLVRIDAELGSPVPSVVIDQRQGSRLATQYLIDRGHQRIGEIHGPLNWFGARARHDSWNETLLAAGLTPGPFVGGDWTARGGYEAAHQLLDQRISVTALVIANDQMALGAMRAIRERGLRVPEDVSVVGFDDIPEAAYFDPPLTTIRQNFPALGEQSVDYLITLIASPETFFHQRVLYTELIERQSVCTR